MQKERDYEDWVQAWREVLRLSQAGRKGGEPNGSY